MTSDYREALELTSEIIPRLPKLTVEEEQQLLLCIPDNEFISTKEITEIAKMREINVTSDQINRRMRKFVNDKVVVKKFNLNNSFKTDPRRMLYRRKGVMG